MNFLNILDEIEKVDGDIYERISPRRKAMRDFFNVGKKISLAAMPLFAGSIFQKAYGQSTPANVTEVLNFALALEYLEYNFYHYAVEQRASLITAGAPNGGTLALNALKTIRDHERQHVDLLKVATNNTGADAYVFADFDFTAGGKFNTYDDYSTLLKVATAFEDTGVRAYKGQAPTLMSNKDVLQIALQIHAVEARHASHLRQMTAAKLGVPLKPWISINASGGANDTGVADVDAVYARENTTTQLGIDVAALTGLSDSTKAKAAAAESFDEFLTAVEVKNIANLFIKTKKLT